MVYTCTFCGKIYQRKGFYDRHISTCELLHVSSKERRVIIAEKLRLSREGVYLTLNELISAGVCLSTPRIPIQLELPLGWNLSSTQEPLLKVSEPCTNQMQFQS